jgi:hypothetical protein
MLVSLLLVPVLYELTHLRQWRAGSASATAG